MKYTKRQKLELLRGQLETEHTSFISHYRELNDHIDPRRGRFLVSDTNKGDRRNNKIIDSTATLAMRTLKSGMMSGVTSPARPWFKLSTPDQAKSESGPVKEWLQTVSQRMSNVYLKTNLYNSLPIVYGDMGTFATAAMYIEETFDGSVFRSQVFPVASYKIATNASGKVDVFFREFTMTIRQLIEKFAEVDPRTNEIDFSNFSQMIQDQYKAEQLESRIEVCHVIYPNPEYNEAKPQAKHKKYASCYYEKAAGFDNEEKFLRESGYDLFPVLCPRWEVSGEDTYGTNCPGMTALGDIKQLQLGEKRIAQAIEKMVNPPMIAPTSMKTTKASIVPGDITYGDIREGLQGFRPIHEVNPRTMELENKQMQIRQRIQRAMYEDLFLMLANDDRSNITATEIAERKEEKLLALGPVLEQLNQDLLDPLIDITFDIMLRQSKDAMGNFIEGALIPEPPEELHGLELKVEYISVMAQAQKLVSIGGTERFTQFAGQVAAFAPDALDKIDVDQMLDVYSDLTSVPSGIVRSDEAVQAIRSQKAQAQQAQQKAEMLQAGAGVAKDLSQADMSGQNALTAILDRSKVGQIA